MNDRYRTDLLSSIFTRISRESSASIPRENPTKEEFDAWKEQVREKAYELMQFPEDAYEKPEVRFLFSRQRDGYRVEKYEISPEPELWIPFLLLVPDTVSTKTKPPAFSVSRLGCAERNALRGGIHESRLREPVSGISYPFSNAMALRYVRKGMVALACDNMGTCEQEGLYDRQQFALKMIFKGRNYVGLSVFCRWAMFNWLAEQDYVDENRMGLAAHSLGTETSMFLALLEPRVKAVSHNDFMSDNEQRIISCFPPEEFMFGGHIHIVPSMHKWFSFPDLIAAFAPKPMLLSEGGVQEDLERIGKAYALAGAPDNYQYVHYPEFQDPANRKLDYQPIPEGITNEEYFRYANVVPEHHYYKTEICIPWMEKALNS